MQNKIYRYVVWVVLCMGMWGCAKQNIVLQESTMPTQETVTESDSELFPYFAKTYGELKDTNVLGELSYFIGGAMPVYALAEQTDVYLVFPAVSAVSEEKAIEAELWEKVPTQLLLETSEVDIKMLPISVGMDGERDRDSLPVWEDIYISTENARYYTVYHKAGYKITAAWAIPEDQYIAWAATLPEDADDTVYYTKFSEWVKTFRTEPVGVIQQIIIENIDR